MNEYRKMSIDELVMEIERCPCACGKCHTGPRYEYARRLWYGMGVTEDKRAAFSYFKEAADFGHEGAQWRTGICYYNGEGIPQDFEKALRYFTKLSQCHAQQQAANLWMGKCYLKIEQRDEAKAMEHLLKAANDSRVSTQGDEGSEAQLLVGVCYYRGFIVEQDFTKAFDYFEKAALYNRDACYYLAECYREGKGTKANMEMYRFWHSKYFESVTVGLEQKADEILGIRGNINE